MSLRKVSESQRKAYGGQYQKHGDSVLSTFQNNRETQNLRFERLMKMILPQPDCFSIHDAGCGLADLHAYLFRRKIDHRYSATEIVPEMAAWASKKYRGAKVHAGDFLAHRQEKYDFVVLSGLLNLPAGSPRNLWQEYSFRFIRKMFQSSRRAAAFNFLTSYRTFSDPALCYFDPRDVLDFCLKNLSRFVVLDHAYPLYESTITVFHSEYLRKRYRSASFKRYLSVGS